MDRRTFIAACGTVIAGLAANATGPVGSVFTANEQIWIVQVVLDSDGVFVLLKSKQPLYVGDLVCTTDLGHVRKATNLDRIVGIVMALREG